MGIFIRTNMAELTSAQSRLPVRHCSAPTQLAFFNHFHLQFYHLRHKSLTRLLLQFSLDSL